jgi:dTDP-4-dehydrorhamnose reductase
VHFRDAGVYSTFGGCMKEADWRIVVIGNQGQIAWELQHRLPAVGAVSTVGRPDVDLADPGSIRAMIRRFEPDVLVNAAAYTAVDQAETEPALAMRVNGEAPQIMAEEMNRIHGLLINYSSDYVFDGEKPTAYAESDAPRPLNVYGASKLVGDRSVEAAGGSYLVFRTSWVYAARGKNFLRTVLRLAAEREELRVVDDQIGAPTCSKDIAQATVQVLQQLTGQICSPAEALGDRRGIYNMTAQGSVSWFGFAQAIVEEMRRHECGKRNLARVVPISSAEYRTAAVRPKNSRLSNEKLRMRFGVELPEWKTSLAEVMKESETSDRSLPH